VIRGIDLEARAGEFVSIVGPSGCGKSTLLNLISGLLRPTHGSISTNGQLVTGVRPEIGYMPSQDSLLPWRTVLANVEFGLEFDRRVSPADRRRHARDMIAAVGLAGFEGYYPHALSGGMRQRVAIARTFARKHRIVLMDEPFSALDAQTRVLVQDLFLSIWERERPTVLLITHDVAEAVALADRVVVLSRGPGTIIATYDIDLARPRTVEGLMFDSPKFTQYMKGIWSDLRPQTAPPLVDSNDVAARRPVASAERS
jgi:NitT/TauT family transport system ATP-binding protein